MIIVGVHIFTAPAFVINFVSRNEMALFIVKLKLKDFLLSRY